MLRSPGSFPPVIDGWIETDVLQEVLNDAGNSGITVENLKKFFTYYQCEHSALSFTKIESFQALLAAVPFYPAPPDTLPQQWRHQALKDASEGKFTGKILQLQSALDTANSDLQRLATARRQGEGELAQAKTRIQVSRALLYTRLRTA